ncbi:MAG: hypothetical protein JRN68_05040 [Nitrososphaerota archaeon]|nr:hypothetical protein [Nitrososphaerota archaeon]
MKVDIVAWATLSPSEDPSRVLLALRGILYPGDRAETATEENRVVLRASGVSSLRKIKEAAASRRVRSVLKRLLLSQMGKARFELLLNRQALTRGIISFCETDSESPLGAVHLEMITDDPRSLIGYLAPV